ncbi:hypothetical protein D3C80_780610 [compost metagenome]
MALTATEFIDPAVGEAVQLHQVQHGVHLLFDLCFRHALQAQAKGNVVEYVQVREQRITLEHHVHAALLRWQGHRIVSGDQQVAAGRRLETGDDPHQCCLAAAAGAEQREDLALTDIEIDVIQGLEGAERLLHVLQLHDRTVHGHRLQWARFGRKFLRVVAARRRRQQRESRSAKARRQPWTLR